MQLIIHKVAGSDDLRLLFGVNADLAGWIHRRIFAPDSFAYKGLKEKGVTEHQMMDVLGLRNPFDRRIVSANVIGTLWNEHSELGPYPALDLLENLEDDSVFYREYREHASIHQLLVYVLGLYIYEHNTCARDALRKEIQQDPLYANADKTVLDAEFLRRWLIAGTAHDIGYVLESPLTDPNEQNPSEWARVKEPLSDFFRYPASRVKALKQMTPEREQDLCNRFSLPSYNLLGADTLVSKAELHKFDPLAEAVGLGTRGNSSILTRYYELGQTVAPNKRGRFRDHGITSASILLVLFSEYQDRIRELQEKVPCTGSNNIADIRDILFNLGTKGKQAELSINAACGAIALHNLNPTLWKEKPDALIDRNLLQTGLHFSLTMATNGQNTEPTPLAFFLRFCDGLQDWGRPKFRRRLPEDRSQELLDEDITVKPSLNGRHEGPLRVFLRDRRFRDDTLLPSEPRFNAFRKEVWRYLRQEDINVLAEYDTEGVSKTEMSSLMGEPQTITRLDTSSLKSDVTRPTRNPAELRAITDLRDTQVQEEAVVRCDLDQNGQQSCDLRWYSVLTVAELYRVGKALKTTSAVLRPVEEICMFSRHLLRNSLYYGTLSKAMKYGPQYAYTLLGQMKTLGQCFVQCDTPEDVVNASTAIEDFLKSRGLAGGLDPSIAIEFVQAMKTYCLLFVPEKDAKSLIEALLRPAGWSAIESLERESTVLVPALRFVVRSRTTDTYQFLKESFVNFNPSILGDHFQKAFSSMPHRTNKHLAVIP